MACSPSLAMLPAPPTKILRVSLCFYAERFASSSSHAHAKMSRGACYRHAMFTNACLRFIERAFRFFCLRLLIAMPFAR